MKLEERMTDIVDQNDPILAAKAIASDIKGMSDENVKAALYFALVKAERKGQASVAKMMAFQAESVLTNIENLENLIIE